MEKKRGQWASTIGFILAAAGSAVGLGNIWKFPGKVGANGGGIFLLVYLIVVLTLGMAVMLGELAMGRRTQKNVVGSFAELGKRWKFVGYLGVFTPFVILSYYGVVGGWVMKYVFTYFTGGHFGEGATRYQDYFVSFISKPVEPIVWTVLFMGICILIILRGVSNGIEQMSKVLMPVFFLLLVGVVIRSAMLPGASEGIRFMLTIDFSSFNRDTLVAAIGQAFFSLSLGMGIMMTYGSYLPKEENLVKSASWICVLDTLAATLAAFAIVPVVYATLGHDGLGMGGAFAFIALPSVFDSIPGGTIVGAVFFFLLFLAALTSAISIMESCIAFVTEEFRISRAKAVAVLALPLLVLGCLYSLSQVSDRGLNMPWFDFANGVQMLPINAVMEKFTDNLMIPLNALLTCIFVGWVWGSGNAAKEIENDGKCPFRLTKVWEIGIRFIAPAMIAAILYFTFVRGQVLS